MSSPPWPRIVAESLVALADPPSIGIAPPIEASWDRLARAVRRAAAPGAALDVPPPFLHATQTDAWRRVMHALRRWRGALLAERVGAGKTWIALAVAARWNRPAVAVVPAILVPQWEAAAARAGVPLRCWTHERASRGAPPPVDARLVIVDEAHRFRSTGTRRVRTLGPWLVGRATLLLTATPIVNRGDDLVALLRLILPDDALAIDGAPALAALAGGVSPPVPVRRVVVRSTGRDDVIRCQEVPLAPSARERERAERAIAAIDRLAFSRNAGVRRLLRVVVADAAASSDAAMIATLRRYRALLLSARDAGGGGRRLLRALAGPACDQLALWSLFDLCGPPDLVVDDLDALGPIVASAPDDDAWIAPLLSALPDDVPAACFARHRATARALMAGAGDATAWVVGSAGGIGPHRMPRGRVLAAFGPDRPGWAWRRNRPSLLVATDVAAEGLDLQGAGCVVHVDLPWTAMRMHQREGRFLRPGQRLPFVRSFARVPAPAFEHRFAPRMRIDRKAAVAMRWCSALETSSSTAGHETEPAPLVAAFDDGEGDGERHAAVALIALTQVDREGARWMVRRADGAWHADDAVGWERLEAARSLRRLAAGDGTTWRRELSAAVRAALATAKRTPPEGTSELMVRIQRLARAAARHRDAQALRKLDCLLRFARSPLTGGGRILLQAFVAARPDRLLHASIPSIVERNSVVARPVALLLFPSRTGALR